MWRGTEESMKIGKVTVGKVALAVALVLAGQGTQAAPHRSPEEPAAARAIDLRKAFGARSPWTFTASQGPDIADPVLDEPEAKVPGALRLCISRDHGETCAPALDGVLTVQGRPDLFSQAHYLSDSRVVFPAANAPILFLQTGSLQSMNGDQRIATVALGYDRAKDVFFVAYEKRVGHNNNQEVRYVAAGPLRGAIISAEPTQDAPFGFWITVNRIDAAKHYAEVLRYRSATRYGDGNPLAVIDSEMPNLQRRLGLWRPGSPMPLPAAPCPKPHLVNAELWCR
jgi:hypothetical protein